MTSAKAERTKKRSRNAFSFFPLGGLDIPLREEHPLGNEGDATEWGNFMDTHIIFPRNSFYDDSPSEPA